MGHRSFGGDVKKIKESIVEKIQFLNKKDEASQLLPIKKNRRLSLKEEFIRKVREEEISL